MLRTLLLVSSFAFFAGSLSYAMKSHGGSVQGAPRVLDCTTTLVGSCTNATADCTISGGSCATGGADGRNGFHNPGTDDCGCQL